METLIPSATRAMRVGGDGEDQIGEAEDGGAMDNADGVAVVVMDLEPGLGPARLHVQQLDADVCGETVFEEELLQIGLRHRLRLGHAAVSPAHPVARMSADGHETPSPDAVSKYTLAGNRATRSDIDL
jgi:hypothetical protein